jgi:hypothetical protein
VPLATAAELREKKLLRLNFLNSFAQIVDKQRILANGAEVAGWVAGLDRAKTVVSATYDQVIEERLKRPYTLVSHVLRVHGDRPTEESLIRGGTLPEEGQIMVVRSGEPPKFYWANAIPLEPDERVVYKPLGSPELVTIPDTDLKVDSGVITETDYATFLQNLGSAQMGVPASLVTRLKSSSVLFVGYTMDVWQYRLMALLFRSAWPVWHKDRRTFAVRRSDNEMERAAWKGLNVELIQMDPNEFAQWIHDNPI